MNATPLSSTHPSTSFHLNIDRRVPPHPNTDQSMSFRRLQDEIQRLGIAFTFPAETPTSMTDQTIQSMRTKGMPPCILTGNCKIRNSGDQCRCTDLTCVSFFLFFTFMAPLVCISFTFKAPQHVHDLCFGSYVGKEKINVIKINK